jgi:hypothetical protein
MSAITINKQGRPHEHHGRYHDMTRAANETAAVKVKAAFAAQQSAAARPEAAN